MTQDLSHSLARLSGRGPGGEERPVSNLELLYDLTFAVAFGTVGAQFAALYADGQVAHACWTLLFSLFGVIWAWMTFSWFSSAYNNDDWLFRLLTMVQMIGVVVMALGFPTLFDSIRVGGLHGRFDNSITVAGYIVIRSALLVLWLRAWVDDPARRPVIRSYIAFLIVIQLAWTATVIFPVTALQMAVIAPVVGAVEMLAPALLERRGRGIPWQPRHIVERFSQLAIITMGEGVVGSTAALSSAIAATGWSLQAVATITAGLALTFGMWWLYFMADLRDVLAKRPQRAIGFSFGHMPVVGAVAATGAGLQIAGRLIAGTAAVSEELATLAVLVPVACYIVGVFAMLIYLVGGHNAFHALLLALTTAVLALAALLAHLHVAMGWCLLVTAAAPFVTVVGFELLGHRHLAEQLRLLEQ